jgi:FkbM family methyltransferase
MSNFQPKRPNVPQRILQKIHLEFERATVPKFDKQTGYYIYSLYGQKVYVKYRHDLLDRREYSWKCKTIYFKGYTPKNGDTVVDFGAGYGEEAVYLSQLADGINYVGIEVLPSVYECLSNTVSELHGDYRVCPFGISSAQSLRLSSQYKYVSVSDTHKVGAIEIFNRTWNEFLELYSIKQIDLLKMNIEGAELLTLEHINDFSQIKRLAIECHDFRADRGHGEHFRTKEKVILFLKDKGYHIDEVRLNVPGYEWADCWIHASLNSK